MPIRAIVVLFAAAAAVSSPAPTDIRAIVAERVMKLTRESAWKAVTSVAMKFRTYHPQGMVIIGDTIFVSSVEVHDRDAGKGVGHLFKIDMTGGLVADLKLG